MGYEEMRNEEIIKYFLCGMRKCVYAVVVRSLRKL